MSYFHFLTKCQLFGQQWWLDICCQGSHECCDYFFATWGGKGLNPNLNQTFLSLCKTNEKSKSKWLWALEKMVLVNPNLYKHGFDFAVSESTTTLLRSQSSLPWKVFLSIDTDSFSILQFSMAWQWYQTTEHALHTREYHLSITVKGKMVALIIKALISVDYFSVSADRLRVRPKQIVPIVSVVCMVKCVAITSELRYVPVWVCVCV